MFMPDQTVRGVYTNGGGFQDLDPRLVRESVDEIRTKTGAYDVMLDWPNIFIWRWAYTSNYVIYFNTPKEATE